MKEDNTRGVISFLSSSTLLAGDKVNYHHRPMQQQQQHPAWLATFSSVSLR